MYGKRSQTAGTCNFSTLSINSDLKRGDSKGLGSQAKSQRAHRMSPELATPAAWGQMAVGAGGAGSLHSPPPPTLPGPTCPTGHAGEVDGAQPDGAAPSCKPRLKPLLTTLLPRLPNAHPTGPSHEPRVHTGQRPPVPPHLGEAWRVKAEEQNRQGPGSLQAEGLGMTSSAGPLQLSWEIVGKSLHLHEVRFLHLAVGTHLLPEEGGGFHGKGLGSPDDHDRQDQGFFPGRKDPATLPGSTAWKGSDWPARMVNTSFLHQSSS